MSLFSLDGKVAVITGSSRGIGKAIAERLPEHVEDGEHHSHKGRWFLFLLAIGGGIYAFVRSRRQEPDPSSLAGGPAGL